MALSGTIDPSNLVAGTEVVVPGSGFTPNPPATILECSPGPSPIGPPTSVVTTCIYVQQSPLVTDGSGEITGNAVIYSFSDTFGPNAPAGFSCPAGGGCAIVVSDAAGEVARVPIGLSGAS